MAKKSVYVFGEIHTDSKNVADIAKRIREIKPDYLLHELLYDDLCYTKSTIEHRLTNCKEGATCDPSLNKDIYKLGLELNCKLIGIDLDVPELNKLSIKEQFRKREEHMCRMIESHLMLKDCVLVIVLGDTHLREKESKELGPSSPVTVMLKKDSRVLIERAPENLQEIA